MEERGGEAVSSNPVVTGCAHCAGQSGTSRREFIAASAASAVAALLVTACGGASGTTGVNTGPVSLSVQVSSYPALANVGGIAEVDRGGTPVAAVRTAANSFAAFSLICPHNGCTVGINGSSFYCPCHGARFAASGAWTGGQPTSNLASLATSYDATTGVLTITS
ncbi:MAG TPA: Rieske (2Fe-2S) protein [Gemmatimonadaceae bacterium]|jgi:Rieske Fe-S protein